MRCLPIRLFFAAFYFVALFFFFACFFVVTFFYYESDFFFAIFLDGVFSSLFFWLFLYGGFFRVTFFIVFGRNFFFARIGRTSFCVLFLDGTFFPHESDFLTAFFSGFFRTPFFFRWHLLFSHEFFFCRTDNGNILNFLSSRGKEEIQRDEDSKRRPIKHMYYYDYLIIRITYRFA